MDDFLIRMFDRLGTWLQRRFAVNIVAARAYCAFCVLFFELAWCYFSGYVTFFIIAGVVFGLALWSRTNEAKQWGDYPENARKVLTLNAHALLCRESGLQTFIRYMSIFFLLNSFSFLVADFLYGKDFREEILLTGVWISLFIQAYGDTIFVLGPGEHGKNRAKVMSNEAVPQTFS